MFSLRNSRHNMTKQFQAKSTLLAVDQEQQGKQFSYSPYPEANILNFVPKKVIRRKLKTQNASPIKRRHLTIVSQSKKNLKQTLQKLQANALQEQKTIEGLSLKSISLNKCINEASQRKIGDLYLSKQCSQNKMRPVVYLTQNDQQIAAEEQKIRSLIKRKVMARDLFRKGSKNDNILLKNKSESKKCKKNLLFFARQGSNYLPHIL